MPDPNPKEHDKLFKWMLSEFTDDFFAYFFPQLEIRIVQSLDKEFNQELEKQKAATEADLLLLVEVEIDGRIWEILIVIEHKSKREDVTRQMQTRPVSRVSAAPYARMVHRPFHRRRQMAQAPACQLPHRLSQPAGDHRLPI